MCCNLIPNALIIIVSYCLGHTHEDIDACFGTISRCINFFRSQILTLDDFKNKVEAYFENSTMKCKLLII